MSKLNRILKEMQTTPRLAALFASTVGGTAIHKPSNLKYSANEIKLLISLLENANQYVTESSIRTRFMPTVWKSIVKMLNSELKDRSDDSRSELSDKTAVHLYELEKLYGTVMYLHELRKNEQLLKLFTAESANNTKSSQNSTSENSANKENSFQACMEFMAVHDACKTATCVELAGSTDLNLPDLCKNDFASIIDFATNVNKVHDHDDLAAAAYTNAQDGSYLKFLADAQMKFGMGTAPECKVFKYMQAQIAAPAFKAMSEKMKRANNNQKAKIKLFALLDVAGQTIDHNMATHYLTTRAAWLPGLIGRTLQTVSNGLDHAITECFAELIKTSSNHSGIKKIVDEMQTQTPDLVFACYRFIENARLNQAMTAHKDTTTMIEETTEFLQTLLKTLKNKDLSKALEDVHSRSSQHEMDYAPEGFMAPALEEYLRVDSGIAHNDVQKQVTYISKMNKNLKMLLPAIIKYAHIAHIRNGRCSMISFTDFKNRVLTHGLTAVAQQIDKQYRQLCSVNSDQQSENNNTGGGASNKSARTHGLLMRTIRPEGVKPPEANGMSPCSSRSSS